METKDGIRNFRERMRFNQAELAEKLGIIQQNVSVWESGKGFPSFQVAKKLLELGATVEEVFGIKYTSANKIPPIDMFNIADDVAEIIVRKGISRIFGENIDSVTQ